MKLSTAAIVRSQEFVPAKEVLKFRDNTQVSCVEYGLDDAVSAWSVVLTDADNADHERDW